MRGSVYRRGSSWSVTYDEPSPDGKRKQRTKGGFRIKAEANAFLTEQLSRLDGGSYSQPTRTTVGAYLTDEWLPSVRGTLRPLSYHRYQRIVALYVMPNVGAVRLQSLTAGHLNSLYAKLAADGLSVSTQRLVHAVIGRSLRDAERWGRTTRNVARLADPPAKAQSRATAWTTTELRRFLAHVADDRLRALWRLGATSGMRRGELAGLTWKAVELDSSRLRVEQQLLATPGGLAFGPPKSRRGFRTIALDDETVAVLRNHLEAQTLERALAGDAYRDADLVFADPLGGAISPKYLSERFLALRKAAGIPVGSLHVLRHTSATIALTSGTPLHVVAARLGDRAETVLGVYSHLLPSSDEAAAVSIAEALVSNP